MYKKILVPLDGTELAEKAIPNVLQLAKENNAEVLLLRVAGNAAAEFAWNDPAIAAATVNEMEGEAKSYMSRIKDKLAGSGIKVTTEVCDGAIAPSIIEVAEKENVDLIAMYTHARTGFGRFFKGSFADKVIHDSTIPVLMVH